MATTPKTMCTNIGGMERMIRVVAGIAILYMGPGLGLGMWSLIGIIPILTGLAGFHALNYSMFELSKGYNAEQMTAYVRLQEAEFAAEKDGYTATKHQREVGTGYFDSVTQVITGGSSSVTALTGSTEEEQFDK